MAAFLGGEKNAVKVFQFMATFLIFWNIRRKLLYFCRTSFLNLSERNIFIFIKAGLETATNGNAQY